MIRRLLSLLTPGWGLADQDGRVVDGPRRFTRRGARVEADRWNLAFGRNGSPTIWYARRVA